jgi:hypothetical protein
MLFLMLLLLVASPAAAQTTCPTGTVFVPNAQPQAGDISLPGLQGICRQQARAPAEGQVSRSGRRPADSTSTPGFTR